MTVQERIAEFARIAANPAAQLKKFKEAGKKVICCMPYYTPEELVWAAGMAPMGLWGANSRPVALAKEYCATFYCSLVQTSIEMMLDGTLDAVDGVITPTMCDTLRPMSQNIKTILGERAIFLAHPQNRFKEYGIQFCINQYGEVREKLEKIAGRRIENQDIRRAIAVYNRSRAARRQFVKLAASHPGIITAVSRRAVLKAFYFMDKGEYTEKLEQLNRALEDCPACEEGWIRVMTSGIICDNPNLLKLFDENSLVIAADDVAHESRAFRVDAPEDEEDGMRALALQFSAQGYDSILYDRNPTGHERSRHLIRLARKNGVRGVIMFITQFCDPEETDYPYIKRDMDIADLPLLRLGVDMQMHDFGQASTSLQAFSAVLDEREEAE